MRVCIDKRNVHFSFILSILSEKSNNCFHQVNLVDARHFTCKWVRPDSRAKANGSSTSEEIPDDELSVAIHPDRVRKWAFDTTHTGETTTWPSALTSRRFWYEYDDWGKEREIGRGKEKKKCMFSIQDHLRRPTTFRQGRCSLVNPRGGSAYDPDAGGQWLNLPDRAISALGLINWPWTGRKTKGTFSDWIPLT